EPRTAAASCAGATVCAQGSSQDTAADELVVVGATGTTLSSSGSPLRTTPGNDPLLTAGVPPAVATTPGAPRSPQPDGDAHTPALLPRTATFRGSGLPSL